LKPYLLLQVLTLTPILRGMSPIQALLLYLFKIHSEGRAVAQAVSRSLPTAAARVRARLWLCGICGGQSGAGAGFLRVLRFPLPISITPITSQSPSSIIWGLYNRPEMVAVPSGLFFVGWDLNPLRSLFQVP
jgi:hypothetical protein